MSHFRWATRWDDVLSNQCSTQLNHSTSVVQRRDTDVYWVSYTVLRLRGSSSELPPNPNIPSNLERPTNPTEDYQEIVRVYCFFNFSWFPPLLFSSSLSLLYIFAYRSTLLHISSTIVHHKLHRVSFGSVMSCANVVTRIMGTLEFRIEPPIKDVYSC